MALPSLLSDPNFIYLTQLLKLSPREVWGILDYGWTLFNLSGDSVYHNSAHLEAILFWKGKRGTLAAAMLKTQFLEKRGAHGLAIAHAEKRMLRWARQRAERAEATAAANGGQRPPYCAEKPPSDPDPVSLPRKINIHTLDLDGRRRKTPGSAKQTSPGGAEGTTNPREGVQRAILDAITGIGVVGPPKSRKGAPPATQPIGSYSATECALWAAANDRGNDDDTARAMWITRAAEMSQYSGGLAYFQDLITTVYNGNNPSLMKGVGKIHNAGAYLNQKTAAWLNTRRSA